MMFSRGLGLGKCLRWAVFVGVVFFFAEGAQRARAEGDAAISPLSNATGPVDSTLNSRDSTPSADYVRKQTEPPRFDPSSPAAKAARSAAPPPRPLAIPTPKTTPADRATPRAQPEVGGIVGDDRPIPPTTTDRPSSTTD